MSEYKKKNNGTPKNDRALKSQVSGYPRIPRHLMINLLLKNKKYCLQCRCLYNQPNFAPRDLCLVIAEAGMLTLMLIMQTPALESNDILLQ